MAAHQASHRTSPRPARPPPRRPPDPGSQRQRHLPPGGPGPRRARQGRRIPGPRRGPLPRPAPPRRLRPRRPGPAAPPPPAITAADLDDATRWAARAIAYRTPPHPAQPGGWSITWGTEIDIRVITLHGTGALTDLAVASYLAKYSTKGTEVTGHASARITADTLDLYASPEGTHPERLIAACWTLGAEPGYVGLRRWAHMLGFGGHFLTKARRYSIRFRDLRDARISYRRGQDTGPEHGPIRTADHTDDETILVVGDLHLRRNRLENQRRRATGQHRRRPSPQTPPSRTRTTRRRI